METETLARSGALDRRPTSPTARWRIALAAALSLLALPPLTATELRCARSGRNPILVVASRSFLAAEARLVEIRSVSSGCLGCHDGTAGGNVLSGPRSQAANLSALDLSHDSGEPMLGVDHPVDVHYPLSSDSFVPLAQLDPRLLLDDGRVTCRTCHPSTTASLSLPMARSELCLGCHRK